MPDYVYALHDFLPEHEDEVTFHAGERIEVVEKDDMYGDGWWQGRNLAGKVGLFPVSYTAPAPPSAEALAHTTSTSSTATATANSDSSPSAASKSKAGLQPLSEESESESPPSGPNIVSPVPKTPATFLNGGADDYEDGSIADDASLRYGATGDNEVMKATMTDVQKAIEQLGRRGGNGGEDGDGARSFSFASTQDGGDTETDDTDFDLSDLDGHADSSAHTNGGEDWHKSARRRLAAKARRAVAEAEKLEAMMGGENGGRNVAPPIEVEMSDESDVEEDGDFTRSSKFQRTHPYILEEDEDAETDAEANGHVKEVSKDASATATQRSSTADGHVLIPPVDSEEVQTATKLSFPVFSPPPAVEPQSNISQEDRAGLPQTSSSPKRSSYPPASSLSPPPMAQTYTQQPESLVVSTAVTPIPSPIRTPPAMVEQKRNSAPGRELTPSTGMSGLPSPSASTYLNNNANSKHNSIMSSSSAPGMMMPVPQTQSRQPSQTQPQSQSQVGGFVGNGGTPSSTLYPTPTPMSMPMPQYTQQVQQSPQQQKTHPSEWNVDEVVEWLKSKGFDQDVCDKFIEQEITGDVLLELDVNLLKSEIGIMAFGKRMRIANFITDLRRPPSIEYSDNHSEHPSPLGLHHSQSLTQSQSQYPLQGQSQSQSQTHSRAQSQSHSHHSFPGTGANAVALGHAYSQSVQSSLGSPLGYGGGGFGYSNGNGNGFGPVQEAPYANGSEGNNGVNEASPVVDGNKRISAGIGQGALAAAAGVGLGIGLTPSTTPGKGRPAQLLAMSPSDGALKDSAAKSVLAVQGGDETEDRGHMSDGEIAPTTTSMRRRLFGRSHDSSVSAAAAASRHSKDSPLPSPIVRDIPDKDSKDRDSTSTKDPKDKDSTKEKDGSKEKDGGKDTVSVGSRHARAKKSMDGGKTSDRLSIFGGTFGGTLGKSRKPPPSSMTSEDQPLLEKSSSKFTLPRLHSSSVRKSSSTASHRPSTPNGSPKTSANSHEATSGAAAIVAQLSPSKDTTASAKKEEKEREKERTTLRKRTTSTPNPSSSYANTSAGPGETVDGVSGPIKQGQNILEQIGEPDHVGWMRKKGDRYNTWKLRYFVLKGPHLYCLRSNNKAETRIKGYIHIVGYKVTVDENVDPGRYGFRIDHDNDRTHYFSSEEKSIVRDWMKAIMKATIMRDYAKPVVSSCNIPTIPLVVAQAMNPAPRPPSPSARDATQKALRRENTDQLSTRDTRILMGLNVTDGRDERARLDSFFSNEAVASKEAAYSSPPTTPRRGSAPPRPSREMRRSSSVRTATNAGEELLIEWANSHLPESLQISNPAGSLCGGLALLRLAESIKGRPSSPPVPDSAFPVDAGDDKLDGLFRLFDFLLDNDVKMGSVSINDVRMGKRDKIVQLLRALKAWEDKRKALMNTIGKVPSAFIVPMVM
ncbi:hypothetical protein B0H34DRAFT_794189 [Crassisporium funariophilum]|nr:hypothetical protein B0H34DRAFT_794189 [Crassisporium funariophilum]